MKENLKKDLELIKSLSKLMKEEEIISLKYEKADFKLDINKSISKIYFDSKQSKFISQGETKNFQGNESKNIQNEKHPGALKAPMVGTAYSSPEPGKPPFVRLGDNVEKDQPINGEAMKVMNTITANKNGKIFYRFKMVSQLNSTTTLIIE